MRVSVICSTEKIINRAVKVVGNLRKRETGDSSFVGHVGKSILVKTAIGQHLSEFYFFLPCYSSDVQHYFVRCVQNVTPFPCAFCVKSRFAFFLEFLLHFDLFVAIIVSSNRPSDFDNLAEKSDRQ